MTIQPKAVFWTLSYIISILAVNWLFASAQLVEGVTFWKTVWGDLFLANLIVGAVFVLVLITVVAAGGMKTWARRWSTCTWYEVRGVATVIALVLPPIRNYCFPHLTDK